MDYKDIGFIPMGDGFRAIHIKHKPTDGSLTRIELHGKRISEGDFDWHITESELRTFIAGYGGGRSVERNAWVGHINKMVARLKAL